MPLSGVFFESLHHQSNRMTMFKKTDPKKCEFDLLTRKALGMELLNLLKFSNK